MCGIALIVSGIHNLLNSSSPPPKEDKQQQEEEEEGKQLFSVDDLKSALRRRGPDSLGTKSVTLPTPFNQELLFIGATLQLRGMNTVAQPFVDSSGNILVYNGEIFGGVEVGRDSNDGEVLLEVLGNGSSSVPAVLSAIKGPWALIYWQSSTRTLWFGRDALGRRSLLVHWPTVEDSRFLLSSVSPFSSVDRSSDIEVENGTSLCFWEELSCGIYSLKIDDVSNQDRCVLSEVKKHEWANPMLQELIKWERVLVKPNSEDLRFSEYMAIKQERMDSTSPVMMPLKSGHFLPMGHRVLGANFPSFSLDQTSDSIQAKNVLRSLRKSVMLRASGHRIFQAERCDSSRQEELVPVAVLFSGGLDSMILAALLNECLEPTYGIDLLNVSFDGLNAPDRISAMAGVKELRRIAPLRRWNLVEIDYDLSQSALEMKHVMSLISPANTYMDLNIGIALWLAASGDGWVNTGTTNSNNEHHERARYKSKARIVLVGSGADEQCAGYGRHRTKYRSGSWVGLHEEMKLDMQRIWKRNMGRDDRCIADNGKEARFPFLDEDVIRTLLDIPLWEVANLDQPSGTGDKKILRVVAQMLGLYEAAVLPKRAIQFGSRIARESNRKNFGSNRAANQASAGSVVISIPKRSN